MILPGEVLQPNKVENKNGFFEVKNGKEKGEIETISKGLIVSICGGAGLKPKDSAFQDIQKLTRLIVEKGGVVVNGGENCGSMLAAAEVAPEAVIGIVCPYHPLNKFGPKAMVRSYFSRKLIIITTPHVVVYEGGTGTMDELISVIGWMNSSQKQGLKPPEAYLQNFWQELYSPMGKIFPPHINAHVHFFNEASDLSKLL